jgi:hypothetical protein
MEPVIGAFVYMTLVRHVRLRQGDNEGWPSVGDTRVQFSVLRNYRLLDLGRVSSAGLSEIAARSGPNRTASRLTNPPPNQKPTAPSLPVLSGRDFSQIAAAIAERADEPQ